MCLLVYRPGYKENKRKILQVQSGSLKSRSNLFLPPAGWILSLNAQSRSVTGWIVLFRRGALKLLCTFCNFFNYVERRLCTDQMFNNVVRIIF